MTVPEHKAQVLQVERREPRRIAKLPHDRAGRPVPWFVQWFDGPTWSEAGDGTPDFRVTDERKIFRALKERRCFICGEPFHGPTETFPIGPMCVVNRISAEPPSHYDCAEHAVHVCPWMLNPAKGRREANLPEGKIDPAGMVGRNPGVIVLWKTRGHEAIRVRGTTLLELGPPARLTWWAEGRPAEAREIAESFASGVQLIYDQAQEEGPRGLQILRANLARALPLLPPDARALLNTADPFP